MFATLKRNIGFCMSAKYWLRNKSQAYRRIDLPGGALAGWVIGAAALVFIGPTLWGQTNSSGITGVITDPSGAVVADATIAVVNEETGVRSVTQSSANGDYTVPLLAVGRYDVTAEHAGFTLSKRTNVHLDVAQVARVDFQLSVGSGTTVVEVQSGTAQLNSENAEVSTVIDKRQVSDLPLAGRAFTNLLLLDGTAYATYGTPVGQYRPTQAGDEIGLGGGRVGSNGYLIDGLNNRDVAYGATILNPSIDAIEEVKIQSKTYGAQYGGAQTIIDVHFKSGTNQIHGTVYEFAQNSFFNVLGANLTGTHQSVPKLTQNQFGYSLGGPIVIPKLYDGRNRAFLFANYEGYRQAGATGAQILRVPVVSASSPYVASTQLKSPYTGLPMGNTVQPTQFSQFALQEIKFLAVPNYSGPGGNFLTHSANSNDYDQQNYKFDYHFNEKNSTFFRYSRSTDDLISGGPDGSGAYGLVTGIVDSNAYQASYTHLFSSTLVNQANFGYVDAKYNQVTPKISSADFQAFGIQGLYPDQVNNVPFVSWSSGSPLAVLGTNPSYPQTETVPYYNWSDLLVWSRGAQTITTGAYYLHWNRSLNTGGNAGTITFNGVYTGDEVADFLLGLPSSIQAKVPTPLVPTAAASTISVPQYTIAPFIQDDWKVNPRLTLNLGVRYDFYKEAVAEKNEYFYFNPNIAGGGECTPNRSIINQGLGGQYITYCPPSGSPKGPIAPRVGFAWRPFGERTVVRMGYGIFFDAQEEQDATSVPLKYPFSAQVELNGTPVTDVLNIANPLPAFTTLAPATLSSLGGTFGPRPKKNPNYNQWTLSVERQLQRDTTLSFNYQGSSGAHEQTRYNGNQALPYDPNNPQPVSARRPWQNFSGDFFPVCDCLSSNYNSGNVTLEHRSRSLVLAAAYTYSKSLDVRSDTFGIASDIGGWAAPINSNNFRQDYGPSTFDIKHRFVTSFVALAPIGRGGKYLNNISPAADLLVGGWHLNGIVTLQSGQPFSIAANDIQGLLDTYGQRANVVGDPSSGFHKSRFEWFNTAAFAQPAVGTYGNEGRNSVRAPGSENWNLSLFKNFTIAERLQFQLRGESFNAFNHTNLGMPDNNVNDPPGSFGVITGAAPGRSFQVAGKLLF